MSTMVKFALFDAIGLGLLFAAWYFYSPPASDGGAFTECVKSCQNIGYPKDRAIAACRQERNPIEDFFTALGHGEILQPR